MMSVNSVAVVAGNPMDVAREAARHGAADAKDAAERFAGAAGLFLSRLVYSTCYTISYGIVFPAVIVARSVPTSSAAARGLREGARAATHRVDTMLARHPTAIEPSETIRGPA
jgi:hypothetical protein